MFKDFLPGVYFRAELQSLKSFTPMARLTAYYPMTSTFNKIPQKPKTPLHFGVDFISGLKFELIRMKYLRFNAGPALHLFFLNSERWNYLDLGGAGFAGFELPLTTSWTVLLNGYASLDYGNLGGNRDMEPFDIVFQYQVDIGIRYSKKLCNGNSWI